MTETYDWQTVRRRAIKRFHDELPHAETEAKVLEAFQANPHAVVVLIDQLGDELDRGSSIRSGWAVLAKRCSPALDAGAPVTATDAQQRVRAIRQAEAWIANAGIHFDSATEVEDELTRLLRDSGGLTEILRERLIARWRELRPIGEQLAQDEAARAAAWIESRKMLAEAAVAKVRALEELAVAELEAARLEKAREKAPA
jgi:hypothetical protein